MSRTQEESGATFAFGIVTAVDAGRGWARARLPEYDNLETAFLPVLQRRTHRDKALDLPDVGEQVALLLDLRGEDGVILGAIWSEVDPVPQTDGADVDVRRYADGTVLRYDRTAHRLTADVQGEIVAACTGKADVTAEGPARVESKAALTLAAPTITMRGALSMRSYEGDGPTTAEIDGPLTVKRGDVTVPDNDVKAGDVSLKEHRHGGVDTGGGTSGPPVNA
jgi:phage baseplate assembly protein V|nr:MAG TPA: baseplate assembly protein [Caudoviricetes sp.]